MMRSIPQSIAIPLILLLSFCEITWLSWYHFFGRITLTTTLADVDVPQPWEDKPLAGVEAVVDRGKVRCYTPCTYHLLPGWHHVEFMPPKDVRTLESESIEWEVLALPWANLDLNNHWHWQSKKSRPQPLPH